MSPRAGLALSLGALMASGCAVHEPAEVTLQPIAAPAPSSHAPDPPAQAVVVDAGLRETKAAAVSRACRWLTTQQHGNGSLAAPGQVLNVDVWETAVALVALLRCDTAADAPVIAKGFTFLDELEVFPSVTGFALSAAAVVSGGDRDRAERGLAWLAARQRPAGDWGAFPDYFWTPYYATAPIVAAFAAWRGVDDPVVAGAVRFTREHQNPDGSWGDAGEPGTTSREFWTTLALLTLQAAGERAPGDVFARGLGYLLGRQQPDGRWIGGNFKSILVRDTQKREDLFTTAFAIVLLSEPPGPRSR